MQKIIIAVVGLIALVGGVWYFYSASTDNNSVDMASAVAIVNGEEISRADFEIFKSQVVAQQSIDVSSLNKEEQDKFEAQVVDELVSKTILEQEANALGIAASQEEIDEQINEIIERLGGQENFKQALIGIGMSEDRFRAQVESELATQAYLEQELNLSSVTATDKEIEAAYAQAVAENENISSLEEVRPTLKQFVIQQKRQVLFVELVEGLRADAEIKVLI